MKILFIIILILLTGCAGFQMSTGVGYRKVPPEVSQPILQTPIILKNMLGFSYSPEQLDYILSFMNSESFQKLIQSALPEDNRVDIGIWFEMGINK